MVIALRLFLLAKALLDKVVIGFTSTLLLAIKNLGGSAVGSLVEAFFLRVWEEVIVFIT